jgi:hypothetical protein
MSSSSLSRRLSTLHKLLLGLVASKGSKVIVPHLYLVEQLALSHCYHEPALALMIEVVEAARLPLRSPK